MEIFLTFYIFEKAWTQHRFTRVETRKISIRPNI